MPDSSPSASSDLPQTSASIVENAVLGLWDVVNQLSSIPQPRRDRYSVTIFGSARLSPSSPVYAGVQCLASELTKLGCDIVTGGGPCLMQAANQGSVAADPNDRTDSVGIRVALDFEQHVNPFVEQMYHHRTFFSRLHHFVLRSDAFVVVPGGIGTTLEMLMIWQLLQVKKLQDVPLILVGPMWSEFVSWAKNSMILAEEPLASPEDMLIPDCVETYDEAIARLKQAHQRWQSEN